MISAKDARRKLIQEFPKDSGLISSALWGKLASTQQSMGFLIAEVLILPILALLLGKWFAPEDALGVNAQFPWPWLVPIIIALHYGALAGLGGSAILLAGWFALNRGQWEEFPQLYFLGGLITVILVGEFSSLWRNKTRRAELAQHYLDQRLEHLVRQFYLLRLSHDRLEQELIGRPMSMRDALQNLKITDGSQETSFQLLQILAQYCQITGAGLYGVLKSQIDTQPIANIGASPLLNPHDPLIRQALETQKICHIAQIEKSDTDSKYLIAAPLLNLSGEIYAILLVTEIPFFSLQKENLQVIGLLLNYYTDGQSAQALAAPLLANYPECPSEFAAELQRLTHIYQNVGIESTLVALNFSATAIHNQLPQQLLRMKRQLDEYWLLEPSPNKQVLAILMPMGNASAAEGYLERIRQWLTTGSEQALVDFGVHAHLFQVGKLPARDLLQLLHGMPDA